MVNVAVTVLLLPPILTVHTLLEVVSHPVQVMVEFVDGVAVKTTSSVVSLYVFVHAESVQVIPVGLDVIVPDPSPVLFIVSVLGVIVVVVPESLINLHRVPSVSYSPVVFVADNFAFFQTTVLTRGACRNLVPVVISFSLDDVGIGDLFSNASQ